MGIVTPHNFRPQELKNYLINGNFYFWQRGTSLTTTSAYGADRWRGNSAISTMNRVDASISPGLPSSSLYGNRVLSLAGGGTISQRIEADMLKPLTGKTVTVSFKAGLISGTSPQMKVVVRKANAKDNWSGNTVVYTSPNLGTPASHTGTYTSYSYSFVVDADMAAKGIAIELGEDAGIWEIVFAEVMLNEGANVAPFRTFGEDIEGEFAACQRYYEQTNPGIPLASQTASVISWGAVSITNDKNAGRVSFAVTKRSNPSVTLAFNATIGSLQWDQYGTSAATLVSTVPISSPAGFTVRSTVTNALAATVVNGQWSADAEL